MQFILPPSAVLLTLHQEESSRKIFHTKNRKTKITKQRQKEVFTKSSFIFLRAMFSVIKIILSYLRVFTSISENVAVYFNIVVFY